VQEHWKDAGKLESARATRGCTETDEKGRCCGVQSERGIIRRSISASRR